MSIYFYLAILTLIYVISCCKFKYIMWLQSRARTKSLTPRSTKSRLADKLGMKKPPLGRSIPTIKESVAKGMEAQRSDIGVSSLSIMGSRDDLNPFM